MNSKEKMLHVLNGQSLEQPPVTPHWWGLYKFQHAGLINGYEDEKTAWALSGKELFDIDEKFYANFKPDMFHLTTSARKYPIDKQKADAIAEFRKRDDILESKQTIDDYVSLIWEDTAEVEKNGDFSHVSICSQKYGNDVFIALNEGSDTAWFFDTWVGFEQGLVGMLEEPENVQYFLSRLYARTLERMKALKNAGAHGFINSETYCSADIMSPIAYKNIILPVQKEFYSELSKTGLIPIVYFTGDIIPMLPYIKELDAKGLMVEAGKKGFDMNIAEIAEQLEGQLALFGNLDSHNCLELGKADDVKKETLKQLNATKGKPFVMCNDCPVSFNTPVENINEMIAAVRNWNG